MTVINAKFNTKERSDVSPDKKGVCISFESFRNKKQGNIQKKQDFLKFQEDIQISVLEQEIREKCKITKGRYFSKESIDLIEQTIKDHEILTAKNRATELSLFVTKLYLKVAISTIVLGGILAVFII